MCSAIHLYSAYQQSWDQFAINVYKHTLKEAQGHSSNTDCNSFGLPGKRKKKKGEVITNETGNKATFKNI